MKDLDAIIANGVCLVLALVAVFLFSVGVVLMYRGLFAHHHGCAP